MSESNPERLCNYTMGTMLDTERKVFLSCSYPLADQKTGNLVKRIVESYNQVKRLIPPSDMETITDYWVKMDNLPIFSALIECNLPG